MRTNKYQIIGIMSGTSLDGIDVVYLTFYKPQGKEWGFEIVHTKLVSFEKNLLQKLKEAYTLPSTELNELSAQLGRFYGKIVNDFITEFQIDKQNIDFIASHGQTIFHQPKKGYTLQ